MNTERSYMEGPRNWNEKRVEFLGKPLTEEQDKFLIHFVETLRELNDGLMDMNLPISVCSKFSPYSFYERKTKEISDTELLYNPQQLFYMTVMMDIANETHPDNPVSHY